MKGAYSPESHPNKKSSRMNITLKPQQNSNNAFLCTICWQYQPIRAKPKFLGQSARIICERCWRAVLDLSICWVCGECVVRGDEVVSLGWCFWHRSCFGCLICGMPISLSEIECSLKSEVDKCLKNSDESSRSGIELENPPLCEICEIETDGDSQESILERGLTTISLLDGGLSRHRFDLLKTAENDIQSVLCSNQQRSKLGCEPLRFSENLTLYDGNLNDIGSLPNKNADMGAAKESTEGCKFSNCSVDGSNANYFTVKPDAKEERIYFSIFDPLGESVFIPSTTKPLPNWM